MNLNTSMESDSCANKWQSTSTSNTNTNVRAKVSAWVSHFVSEMRTKSPTVVQKWVDSIPSDTQLSTEAATTHSPATDQSKNINLSIVVDDGGSSSADKSAEVCETNDENVNVDGVDDDGVQVQLEKTDSNKLNEKTAANVSPSEFSATTKFWRKGPAIISQAFTTLTDEIRNESAPEIVPEAVRSKAASSTSAAWTASTASAPSSILSKAKINEFYNKLSINRKRYSFVTERRMEARQMLNVARDRYMASPKNDATDKSDISDSEKSTTSLAGHSPGALIVCDSAVEMDVSADEFSHFSHSNDNVSAEDSFNLSTQSITEGGQSSSQLNVGRKMGIGEIGRSTSDNPRLRNKIHLADIGRSFSEHQDEDAIIIGNISAPSSSIAIQNNNNSNKSGENYFERRAYSVSPTQRGSIKRGMLSRDQSLCDSPRHRNVLRKEGSFHSDSSHCSSVESLLDARKPDPEAILRHLGFGPVQQEDLLSRIPKRFLKPSQVPGIDTEAFMRQQQIASNLHEQSILGYRGLVGNPHVPPSLIVAKIMEQFQISEKNADNVMDTLNSNRPLSAPPTSGKNVFDMPDISET